MMTSWRRMQSDDEAISLPASGPVHRHAPTRRSSDAGRRLPIALSKRPISGCSSSGESQQRRRGGARSLLAVVLLMNPAAYVEHHVRRCNRDIIRSEFSRYMVVPVYDRYAAPAPWPYRGADRQVLDQVLRTHSLHATGYR